jgi:hypothetical protein
MGEVLLGGARHYTRWCESKGESEAFRLDSGPLGECSDPLLLVGLRWFSLTVRPKIEYSKA